jgi:hypothetical protein
MIEFTTKQNPHKAGFVPNELNVRRETICACAMPTCASVLLCAKSSSLPFVSLLPCEVCGDVTLVTKRGDYRPLFFTPCEKFSPVVKNNFA